MNGPPEPPQMVLDELRGWNATLEWTSAPHAATWKLQSNGRTCYLKVQRIGGYPDLSGERRRMNWALGRLPVPEPVGYGCDAEREWLLTRSLPGVPATHADLRREPAHLVSLLARGLRALHRTPAGDCPFSFRLDEALDHVERRVRRGLVDPARDFQPEHAHLTPEAAMEELRLRRPESEDLVLCHGDYCPPNVLVRGGRVSGYVDLGQLAVADRWWDLAAATWSVTWNLGAGWEEAFLREYGIQRDEARMTYFRLLRDLAS